jgi:hypothetical protein
VRLLLETGLAQAVLPEIVPQTQHDEELLHRDLRVLEQLRDPSLPAALAALLHDRTTPEKAEEICRRWRLPNKEIDCARWLVENYAALDHARAMRWSAAQPLFVDDAIHELLALMTARAEIGLLQRDQAEWCREQLSRTHAALDPAPLLTGDDLLAAKVPQGPRYRLLLQRVRDAQLDGEIGDRREALALVERLLRDEP